MRILASYWQKLLYSVSGSMSKRAETIPITSAQSNNAIKHTTKTKPPLTQRNALSMYLMSFSGSEAKRMKYLKGTSLLRDIFDWQNLLWDYLCSIHRIRIKLKPVLEYSFWCSLGGLSDKNYDHIKNLDSFHFVVGKITNIVSSKIQYWIKTTIRLLPQLHWTAYTTKRIQKLWGEKRILTLIHLYGTNDLFQW